MGFSRQEYWSGLPFPSPGDLPDPGIEHVSPTLQADSLPSKPPGKPTYKKTFLSIKTGQLKKYQQIHAWVANSQVLEIMKWISLETDHPVSLSWVSVASPTEAGLAGWDGELFVGGRADTQLPICSTLQWQPGLSYLPGAIRWVAGALGLHHSSQAISQSPFLTLPSFLSSIESVPGGHRVKQAARETKAKCRAGAGRRKCPSCRVQPGPGSSSRWAGWCGTWRKGRSSTGSAWVLPSTWPQSSSTWQVMWTRRSGNSPR